jgi:hypothetical protein
VLSNGYSRELKEEQINRDDYRGLFGQDSLVEEEEEMTHLARHLHTHDVRRLGKHMKSSLKHRDGLLDFGVG